MDKRSRSRDKEATYQAVYDAVIEAQRFGASKATSHYVARRVGITPQYANRILMNLWRVGTLGFRWDRKSKNSYRRLWVTNFYAKNHAEFLLVSDMTQYEQMELPL